MWRKAVSVMLSLTVVLQPLIPHINYAMAQDAAQALTIEQGAQMGNDLWNDLKGGMTYPVTNDGTTFTIPQGTGGVDDPAVDAFGEEVSISSLFQAPTQDSSFKDMYSLENEEFEQRGIDARAALQQAGSAEGNAYRVLRESVYLSKPDLTNDPLWGSTDAVYDFLEGGDQACDPQDTHEPDYRTCERLNVGTTACEVVHDVEIVPTPSDIVFLIDNSASMDGVIASLRASLSNMVYLLSQDGERDLRLGGAVTRAADFTWNNIDLTDAANFSAWLNAVRTKSATTQNVNAGLYVLENFDWRDDPDVERLIVIIGNDDNPNGDSEAFKSLAAAMDVDVYVFHDNAAQKELGVHMANTFNATDLHQMIKLLVTVYDSWGPSTCIAAALADTPPSCSRGYSISNGSVTGAECVDIDGFEVCPDDPIYNQLTDSPLPGVNRLALSVSVAELQCSYSETGSNNCAALEANTSCGFISSECKAVTPDEQVRDLYEFGLNRTPSSSEFNYWHNRLLSVGDYDVVREEFFQTAEANGEEFINRFTCKTFTDTYDCAAPAGGSNYAACQVKEIFQDDFADCTEELVPQQTVKNINIEQTESCEETLVLTECAIERELTAVSRQSTAYYSRPECFISDEVSYRVPWHVNAATASISLNVSGQHTSASVVQQPSEANGWVGRIALQGSGEMVTRTRQVPRTCMAGETEPCYSTEQYEALVCPAGSSLEVELIAQGYAVELSETEEAAEEGNSPCLRESDDWTDTTWTCQQQASPQSLAGLSAAEVGYAVDPIYEGGSPLCTSAVANYTTKQYSQGEFCWTDMNGVEQCENIDSSNGVTAGNSTCQSLEARTASGECRYVGRYPFEDGEGSSGFQYVWEHRYACITDTYEVTKTELVPEYTCEGIVRCMGDECMTPNRETSDSFTKAVGMLQALEQIGQDITCDVSQGGNSMTNCQVFGGEAQTCKMAVGGWVDCCETPSGVSLSDYITLLKATSQVDNFVMSSGSTEFIRGSYSSLRNPVVESYQYLKNEFTKQVDNISGAVLGDSAGGIGGTIDSAQVAFEGFKQSLMSGANDFLTNAFGEEVASFFFEQTADGAVQLASGFSAALSVIGTIYTIYTIAKIIVNLIWKCTEEELQLGVDRQLKKTRYIGSYCRKKILGSCIEKRKSFCVFSSPLARIINEQARPQLGRSWGSPKNPDCSGITLAELETLDWSQIDLSEWLDLLDITGNMPGTGDLGLETLTGADSFLGQMAAEQGETRLNTADRNVERLEGVDLQKLNQRAAQDLWSNQ